MSAPTAGGSPASGSAGSPRVVLIGPMGAGKSTVGRQLAARWGAPLVDTDEMVATRAGRGISDIFIDDGEPAFRELERAAVAECMTTAGAVIALGGGAVLDERTQADLRVAASVGAQVVFLDLDSAAASRRVGLGVGRPLLLGNPRATWVKLLTERRGIYEQLATLVIDTADQTPAAIAEEIIDVCAQP